MFVLDLYLRLATGDCSPGIPRHNEAMSSSASQNKAPSVLKQSLITSGVILLLGIWHTVSGKNKPSDSYELTGVKDEGEHQYSTLSDENSGPSGKDEKSEGNESKAQSRERKVWLYEFTLSIFPTILTLYAALAWRFYYSDSDIQLGIHELWGNWSKGMDGVVWNIISILYAGSFLIIIFIGGVRFRVFILFGLLLLNYFQLDILARFNLGEEHWLSVVFTLAVAMIAALVLQIWFSLPDSRSKSKVSKNHSDK